MSKISMVNSYNANDIRRRMNSARINVTNYVIEEITKDIVRSADNNYPSVKIDLDGERFEKYRIDGNVLRNVRNHFETLKFSVYINQFRNYILIQW